MVGAGIAGLTTALCLARRGIASTLVERSPVLKEAGAGLQLSPNALRVLDRLGLLPHLSERAVTARSVTLCDGRTGRTLARVPVAAADGTPYLSLHRADLQAVLLEAVEADPLVTLRLGCALAGIDDGADIMTAHFEGPDERVASAGFTLLIAADGVNSRVASIRGLSPPVHSGALAWRARVVGRPTRELASTAPGIRAWLGPGMHAVAYPIRAGEEINLVLVEKTISWGAEDAEALRGRFSAFAPELRALVSAAGEITAWPILTTPPERPWVLADGRIVLVGDAAHAMLPFAAQGAAMAIEDGFVLARETDRHGDDPGRVGQAFEQARRSRVRRVEARARFHRFVYHLPQPVALVRNLVMATTPDERLSRSLSWLYDWVPPK
ncbi:FAD-dependent monooxygenase [Fulvimarina sp. 2208YS6-2-32]|uniref:FAD-dependent monooxygenase n=1 Tax=Fulvimarina uroteuthidis TaxID=3098149 RepID=A0ABU5I3K6_9HYPH|nr:FAD-dependent monooxygenase [Fulvimarina sp. 2208YS6-2-32]MDY8109969.1 FAD-dependent monooxygenase [Fulvimarina sp. 2208YS6-2-32]